MKITDRMKGYGLENEETVEDFRKVLYQMHPDFGNYGKGEKKRAIAGMMKDLVPDFYPTLSKEYTDGTIQDTLEALGEEDTYSALEFGWDVGMPTVGGIAGSRVGMPAAGAGAGAILGETLKMRYERDKRGIEQEPFFDTVGKTTPIGLMEMIFQKGGGFLLDRLTAGIKRRVFLPRGGISAESKVTQELLSNIPAAEGKFAKAFRWIYGHPALSESLTIGQLGAEERTIWSQIEAMAASGFFSGGLYERRLKSPLKGLQNLFLEHINKLGSKMEPEAWGRIVAKTLQGEVDFAKVLRNRYWGEARQALQGRGIQVDIGDLMDFWIEEYGKRRRRDVGQVITKLNDFFGWNLKREASAASPGEMPLVAAESLRELPREISAEAAADLWQALNASRTKGNAPIVDNMTKIVKGRLFPAVDDEFGTRQLLETAHQFHMQSGDAIIKNRTVNNMLKSMLEQNKPGSIVSFIAEGKSVAERTSNLRHLRDVYLGTYQLPGGRGAVGTRKATYADWVNDVLKPLRFKILMNSYDTELQQFSGNALRGELKRLGAQYGPEGIDLTRTVSGSEYLDMVFGKEGLQQLDRFATALDKASTSPAGQTIVMKIMQARAMGGIVSEGLKPSVARDITVLATGPLYLANLMTNKRLLADLTSGLEGGARSTQLNRVLATLGRMHTKAAAERRDWTANEIDFYEGAAKALNKISPDQSLPTGPLGP